MQLFQGGSAQQQHQQQQQQLKPGASHHPFDNHGLFINTARPYPQRGKRRSALGRVQSSEPGTSCGCSARSVAQFVGRRTVTDNNTTWTAVFRAARGGQGSGDRGRFDTHFNNGTAGGTSNPTSYTYTPDHSADTPEEMRRARDSLLRENESLKYESVAVMRERELHRAESAHAKEQAWLLQESNSRYEARVLQLEALVRACNDQTSRLRSQLAKVAATNAMLEDANAWEGGATTRGGTRSDPDVAGGGGGGGSARGRE